MQKAAFVLLFLFCIAAELPAAINARIHVFTPGKASFQRPREYDQRIRIRPNGKYAEVLTSRIVESDWKEYSFTFTPGVSGKAKILLFSAGRGREHFVHFEPFRVTGAELGTAWQGKGKFLIPEPGTKKMLLSASGKNPVWQEFPVRAGVPVTISTRAREIPLPPPKGGNDVNIAVDPSEGSEILISKGRLTLIPTFENCSVYLNLTPEEKKEKLNAELFFREKGNSRWLPSGLPFVYVLPEKSWRGSLVMLKENTVYEAEIRLSNKKLIRGEFRTRSSAFPVVKTVILSSNTPTPFKAESGTAGGYIRYTGTICGKSGDEMVISAEKSRYVIFENLTVKANGARHGIVVSKAENIAFRNCDISGFARKGVRRTDLDGKFYIGKNFLNNDAGIRIADSKNILVERCYIHHPAWTANTWFYSHPAGPNAILAGSGNQNLVIRYNDFAGNDRGRFNDLIEGAGNGSMDGGFFRDGDIYGNLFIFSNDDAIELEGGGMNLRFYFNRIEGTMCGTSTGSCRLGPCYLFRNIYNRPGDELGFHSIAFKNGHQIPSYGTVVMMHNTFGGAFYASLYGGFYSLPFHDYEKPLFKSIAGNNLICARGNVYDRFFLYYPHRLFGDMVCYAPGVECPRDLQYLGEEKSKVNFVKEPGFRNESAGDFRLAPRSPARNKAVKLPRFQWPHAGAFQEDGVEELPFRNLALTAMPKELFFPSFKETASRKVTVRNTGAKALAFVIRRNDDFFAVTPEKGVVAPGKSVTLTVKILPEKIALPKLCKGVFFIRTQEGLSRPVTVYSDFRECPKRRAEQEKHGIVVSDLKGLPGNTVTAEFQVPKAGIWFLLADCSGTFCRSRQFLFIKAKVNGRKLRQPRLQYFPGPRSCWSPLINGSLCAEYLKLPAGKCKVELFLPADIRFPGFLLRRLLLTQEPDLFAR